VTLQYHDQELKYAGIDLKRLLRSKKVGGWCTSIAVAWEPPMVERLWSLWFSMEKVGGHVRWIICLRLCLPACPCAVLPA
jgi:hypothetical protein